MLLIAQVCLAVVTIVSVLMALVAIFRSLWSGTTVETEARAQPESQAPEQGGRSPARASLSPRFGTRPMDAHTQGVHANGDGARSSSIPVRDAQGSL